MIKIICVIAALLVALCGLVEAIYAISCQDWILSTWAFLAMTWALMFVASEAVK
jgi:hypothetical protein